MTFLDLFCGCGGFTYGMLRADFRCLAALDLDPKAIEVLKANLIDRKISGLPPVDLALESDLTKFGPKDLADLTGVSTVDVIVGGPPCQGFSTARQVDGSNHGDRLKIDPRRLLYREFLKYVDFFQPKIFVMENVLGMRSAAGGEYFTRVHKEARELGAKDEKPGYRVHSQVENAWELGVPQKRRRQLFIGVRCDLPGYFPTELKPAPHAIPGTNLGAAICDLPALKAGTGKDEREYDLNRRRRHFDNEGEKGRNYLRRVVETDRTEILTNHVARPHNERDLRDFARLKEGENSATAMRDRGVEFEHPYDKENFKDRYTRQNRREVCSTIVAHLSKDGLMFIHPTQNRSITPREAARIQSFPDWFRFPEARTHSFRLIGNAVPPLVGEAVGVAICKFLAASAKKAATPARNSRNLPRDKREAVAWLLPFLDMDAAALRKANDHDVKKAWTAVACIFGDLHPDSALDHGKRVSNASVKRRATGVIEPRLAGPYFEQSGWPIALAPLAKEAWRRFRLGVFGANEFYCVDAQIAGMRDTDFELATNPF